MKLYPWLLNYVPPTLYMYEDYRKEATKEQEEVSMAQLKELFRHNQQEPKRTNPDKRTYLTICEALKIEPEIRMKWKKPTTENQGTVKEMLKRLDGVASLYGKGVTYKESKTAEVKTAKKRVKTRTVEAFHIGGSNWEKMSYSLQAALWKCVEYVKKDKPKWLEEPKNKSLWGKTRESCIETLDYLSKILDRMPHYCLERGRPFRDILSRNEDLYYCGMTAKLKSKAFQPPETVCLFANTEHYTDYKNVDISGMPASYQKYKPKIPVEPRFKDSCYVDTRSGLVEADVIQWSETDKAWVPGKSKDKWLCSNPHPVPQLLEYAAQPSPLSQTKKEAFRHRKHVIGIEIEFDTMYHKGVCIHNSDGRPLTPVKVLDEFGWALCPDRSVGGGELKSPLLCFDSATDADQIVEQIPKEIQKFIDSVNKSDRCGGHINYSSPLINPLNAMMCIMAWGFVFPILYPNRLRNHYCKYQKITEPIHKYQWLRVKNRCIETRIFPAHWDIQNILWRGKLIAMMIEEELKESKRRENNPTAMEYAEGRVRTICNLGRYSFPEVNQRVLSNWKEFTKDQENTIRQHIVASIGRNQMEERIASPDFLEAVQEVLELKI